jgi:hypothetical protein
VARRRRNQPALGEWKPTPGVGWQFGPVPELPDGLLSATRATWAIWMGAWFAANWSEADLPGLRLVILQYDAVHRAGMKANDVTALVRLMDNYGITPAGQQARRWAPPKPADPDVDEPAATDSPYADLRVIV